MRCPSLAPQPFALSRLVVSCSCGHLFSRLPIYNLHFAFCNSQFAMFLLLVRRLALSLLSCVERNELPA
jgi:hypothetical protein